MEWQIWAGKRRILLIEIGKLLFLLILCLYFTSLFVSLSLSRDFTLEYSNNTPSVVVPMALPVDDVLYDEKIVTERRTSNNIVRITATKVPSFNSNSSINNNNNEAANVEELAKRMAKRMLEKERNKIVQAQVVDTTLDDFKILHWGIVVIIVVIAAIALIVAANEGHLW